MSSRRPRRPSRIGRIGLALLTLCLGLPAVAPAQPDPARRRAYEDVAKASTAYEQGRFLDAIELYRKAFAVTADPTLQFNLGRCFEALGDVASLREAVAQYEGYVAHDSAADRAAVEQRVRVLRRQIELLTRPPPPVVRRVVVQPLPERSWAPWAVTGLGAAGLAAGGALGWSAASRHDEAVQASSATRAQELDAQAQSRAHRANLAFIAGGAVTAAGVLWIVLDRRSTGRARQRAAAEAVGRGLHARVELGPGGAIVYGWF